eukprot:evm.model.NODE_12976_length_9629_cov_36.188908.4
MQQVKITREGVVPLQKRTQQDTTEKVPARGADRRGEKRRNELQRERKSGSRERSIVTLVYSSEAHSPGIACLLVRGNIVRPIGGFLWIRLEKGKKDWMMLGSVPLEKRPLEIELETTTINWR